MNKICQIGKSMVACSAITCVGVSWPPESYYGSKVAPKIMGSTEGGFKTHPISLKILSSLTMQFLNVYVIHSYTDCEQWCTYHTVKSSQY